MTEAAVWPSPRDQCLCRGGFVVLNCDASTSGGGGVMRRIVLGMVLLAASGAVLAAQLYRWVDEKGIVEYRDTPPPASAKKVETRSVSGGTVETPALPYSVQQAVLNFP